MPHTTYALFKAIRSHQISSPRVEPSARHGVPNACNLCHLDKTLGWTQGQLTKRYGQKSTALSEEQQTVSAALLWLLKGHAAQRVIAGWHLGWGPAQEASGKDWLVPFAAKLLPDSYGVVRYVAARSLRTLPGFGNFAFDFLAPESELVQKSNNAITQWQNQSVRPARTSAALLLDSEGHLLKSRIETLVRERDDRPVTIKE